MGLKDDALRYIKSLMIKRYNATDYNKYSLELNALDKDALRVQIANERRKEFAYQGHRWFDLRRTTQPELVKVFAVSDEESQTYTLELGDERYTLRFPAEAVAANPEIEKWD